MAEQQAKKRKRECVGKEEEKMRKGLKEKSLIEVCKFSSSFSIFLRREESQPSQTSFFSQKKIKQKKHSKKLKFLFLTTFIQILILFLNKRMKELLFLLLLSMEMNKLLKFYWKKENQMLIFQIRLFC